MFAENSKEEQRLNAETSEENDTDADAFMDLFILRLDYCTRGPAENCLIA